MVRSPCRVLKVGCNRVVVGYACQMIRPRTRQSLGSAHSPLLALFSVLLLCSGLKAQTITVLVVYTPAVERALGVNGARALAINSIESVNQVMRNSGLPSVSYRLAGNLARKVNYVESVNFMNLDLERLQNPADGIMDDVHAWRTQVGADLVHLLRLGPAGDAAGIAYLSVSWNAPPPPVTPGPSGNAAFGFAVTAHDAAVSNFTFAHEIGHNMGLYHAREDTDSDLDAPANRDYWFGYRFKSLLNPTQVFNTVMAYQSTVRGLTQSRIPHFSNPLIRYAVTGDRLYPTGLRSTGAAISSYVMPPETSGILPQGPSDQIRALRENAPVVSAYFVSPPTSTLAAMGSWDFAPVRIGSSLVREVVLQNRDSSPVTVDPLVLPDPVFTTSWAGGVIPPRGSIRIPVRFQPAVATSYGGDVSVTVGGALQATVSCRGLGLAAVAPPSVPPPPAPSLSISGSWEFMPVRVGLSAVRSVTIQNRGSSPVSVDPLAMPHPVFTTSWAGGVIPARGSISVPVTFRPATATDYSGSVAITVGGAPLANVVCRGTGRR